MSKRKILTTDVFNAAIDRMVALYQQDNRVIVAFSGGKDSTCILEVSTIAAQLTNRLPVEVWMLDDEAMYPGTFEYAEEVAARSDIKFHWVIAGEPMVAAWNRQCPYWWIFDDRLKPEEWMRIPPDFAIRTNILDMYDMVNPHTFPPPQGRDLFVVTGVRASEAGNRNLAIHSAGGYITGYNHVHTRKAMPIYDWRDGDVWKAISDNKWNYNTAYDTMTKMGIPKKKQRIAPPTMVFYGMNLLEMASRAWPKWYNKLEDRVPGARAIANFGMRAVQPLRRTGETWKECYERECINNAPQWIRERGVRAIKHMLSVHAAHSTTEFPQNQPCKDCGQLGSWRTLGDLLYTGDPYSLKATFLPYVQPNAFRPEDTRAWKFHPSGGK